MPGKRSRASKSQSFGDMTSLVRRMSPELRCGEAGGDSEHVAHTQSLQVSQIMAIGTDVPESKGRDGLSGGGGGGNAQMNEHFLERCHLCKKRLSHGSDVYMYGYLRAFCSPDCRDVQIEMEKAAPKVLAQSTNAVTWRAQ
ncbi:hypothetical protein Tsubulata_039382 [Turnera subulata]|uniref:FLZ-type domain-containing protein n=1 Tax=Turnera subulata TaxID=218843 RepID=A0A9Q0G8U7_9ROSI|nr:hypothetical protein Tsubulata_039382 [Turnera subulata]